MTDKDIKKDLNGEKPEGINEEPDEEVKETSEADPQDAPEDAGQKPESPEEDEDLNTRYMRLMADFQNFKRRADKERNNIYAYANEDIVIRLLDVMDNFERALEHESEDTKFKEGMLLIFNQLQEVLKAFGVEEIEADGVTFDPNYHNAVMNEDTDATESGNVSAVLQKGYTLKGKVIRAAMVKVAK